MKKLIFLFLGFFIWQSALSQDIGGGFFPLSTWRDSSGTLVSVPAGKPVLFVSPASGTNGFLSRANGTLTPANATDTIQAPYFKATTSVLGQFGFFGTGQNTALIPLAARNFAGTNVAGSDSLGRLFAGINTPYAATFSGTNKGQDANLIDIRNRDGVVRFQVDSTGLNQIGSITYLKMSADTANATRATPKVIGGLEVNIPASQTYEFQFNVQFTTSNVGTGLQTILSFPSTPTSFSATYLIPTGANGTTFLYGAQQTAATDTVAATATSSTAKIYTAIITGKIVNSTNAGSLRLWFMTQNTVGSITIKSGSSGWIRRVS